MTINLLLENCVALSMHVTTINYGATGKWTKPGDFFEDFSELEEFVFTYISIKEERRC